jgi:predicted enzyme related to lactoylglutathione lyase
MSSSNGAFVWYELLTTDADAAQDFYAHVIGWTAHDAALPDRRYTILQASEQPVAGLMLLPEAVRPSGGRPGWIGYVGVSDVDGYAARVCQAGGRIHRAAKDIPHVGRFAVLADPQGAIFVLFAARAGTATASTPPDTPGHAGWHELRATNWQDAFAFYCGLFGWRKTEAIDMGAMGSYQLFASGSHSIGGMMSRSKDSPGPYWLFYWNVADINAAAARVSAKAGEVLNGPHPVPGGKWIVHCLDPQGAMFALVAAGR